jgi:serine/threonine protein kinase
VVPQHPTGHFVDAHYDRVKVLGEGTFGRVDLIRDRATGSLRVCKEVDLADKPTRARELTRLEIEVLADMDHPNIIKIYEYCEDVKRNIFNLILEYISGGDCKMLLHRYPSGLNEGMVGQIVYQTLQALKYCHEQCILHRDKSPTI